MAAETQIAELEKLLKKTPGLAGMLQYTDTQNNVCLALPLKKNPQCPACVRKTFRIPKTKAAILCGDGEFLFELKRDVDLESLKSFRQKRFGDVLKIRWKQGEFVVFASGRVLCP